MSGDWRGLDWRTAVVGDLAPCVLCGKPALLRHPVTGKPTHKVCAEKPRKRRRKRS